MRMASETCCRSFFPFGEGASFWGGVALAGVFCILTFVLWGSIITSLYFNSSPYKT